MRLMGSFRHFASARQNRPSAATLITQNEYYALPKYCQWAFEMDRVGFVWSIDGCGAPCRVAVRHGAPCNTNAPLAVAFGGATGSMMHCQLMQRPPLYLTGALRAACTWRATSFDETAFGHDWPRKKIFGRAFSLCDALRSARLCAQR